MDDDKERLIPSEDDSPVKDPDTVEDKQPQGGPLSDYGRTEGYESVDSDTCRQAVEALGATKEATGHQEMLELKSPSEVDLAVYLEEAMHQPWEEIAGRHCGHRKRMYICLITAVIIVFLAYLVLSLLFARHHIGDPKKDKDDGTSPTGLL